ncbi:MAG: dihydrouridine synthase [Nitrospirae bacterium GWC2_57_13]|nr:MAG: dihydrouridine synthase [Nitrospirae bacterium GWC2_57_13]OGW40689.1 MAG: dihydrouridine synthase [Nitrospirae bacterium GWD2_57_8]
MIIPCKPIHIRGLHIDPPLLLAPMAGLTHSALRQIIAGFGGVGLYSTEMLSAKRLPTENAGRSPYLIRTASDRPLSYQLLTSRPEELAPALEKLHELKADAVDLNMGCPAPVVGRFGAGIRLMEKPENARCLAAEARKRTSLPLTAKIRIGIDLDEGKLQAFCAMLEDEGIDMVSIHARLKHEPFARRPRWERIADVKNRLKIPIVVNGGIFSVQDAEECLRISGADGLMLGRGAVIRPWLFGEIARDLYGCALAKPVLSLPAVYTNLIDLLGALFLPEHRLGRLKQFTRYFSKNYKFGHHLATRVHSSATMEEARERAILFFAQNS